MQISRGGFSIRNHTLVRVHTDEGITGLSEMFRVPPGVARSALVGMDSFFGSQIIGAKFVTPEAIWNRLYENMLHSNRRGWAMRCLGALDIALWDIAGKAAGVPVATLLGGILRPRVELAACMGIQTYERAGEIASLYVEQGFTTLKTKAGSDMLSNVRGRARGTSTTSSTRPGPAEKTATRSHSRTASSRLCVT